MLGTLLFILIIMANPLFNPRARGPIVGFTRLGDKGIQGFIPFYLIQQHIGFGNQIVFVRVKIRVLAPIIHQGLI